MLALVVAACAKLPFVASAPKASLSVSTSRDLNACTGNQGYPLKLRILQVGDTTGITGSGLPDVWGHERDVFTRGGGVLASTDTTVDPNVKLTYLLARAPKATAMVLIGNFCKPSGSSWYYVHPFKRGSKVKVSLDACCILPEKH